MSGATVRADGTEATIATALVEDAVGRGLDRARSALIEVAAERLGLAPLPVDLIEAVLRVVGAHVRREVASILGDLVHGSRHHVGGTDASLTLDLSGFEVVAEPGPDRHGDASRANTGASTTDDGSSGSGKVVHARP